MWFWARELEASSAHQTLLFHSSTLWPALAHFLDTLMPQNSRAQCWIFAMQIDLAATQPHFLSRYCKKTCTMLEIHMDVRLRFALLRTTYSATCCFCELLQHLQCLQQIKQQDGVSQCWETDPTQFTPIHKFVWLLVRLDIYTVIKEETGHHFKVSRIFTCNYSYSQMPAGSHCTLGNLLQGNIPFVLPCF